MLTGKEDARALCRPLHRHLVKVKPTERQQVGKAGQKNFATANQLQAKGAASMSH